MHRTLLLPIFCLVTAGAVFGGDNGGDNRPFVLDRIVIAFVGLVTVQAVDPFFPMRAVLPLAGQAGRGFLMAFDAFLAFLEPPVAGIQFDFRGPDRINRP
jgi:hypothetical protein